MKCKRCGYCCTLRVKLNFFEYFLFLLFGYRDFSEKNIRGNRFVKIIDGDCYFLDKNVSCKIYKFRPLACRRYPGVDVCPHS